MFDQELNSRIFKEQGYRLALPISYGWISPYDNDSTYSVGILGVSAVYKDDRLTSSGIPLFRIEQTARYNSVMEEFEGGISAERYTTSGKSLFGVRFWTTLLMVDPIETADWMVAKNENLEFFSYGGKFGDYNERVYIAQTYFNTNILGWQCSMSYTGSINPNKYRPMKSIGTFLPDSVSYYHRYYYPKGLQDDMTVTCQIRKDPTKIIGGRAEYRYYRSWCGVRAGIPEHRGLVEVEARIQTGLKASLTWQGYSSSDWSDVVVGVDSELPAWGVWSLSVSQSAFRGKLEGTIRVWNLTDQIIRTHPLGPMRPRRLELAIQVMIG
jgi:hypothetical protein